MEIPMIIPIAQSLQPKTIFLCTSALKIYPTKGRNCESREDCVGWFLATKCTNCTNYFLHNSRVLPDTMIANDMFYALQLAFTMFRLSVQAAQRAGQIG